MLYFEEADIFIDIDTPNKVSYYKYKDESFVQVTRSSFWNRDVFGFYIPDDLFFEFIYKNDIPVCIEKNIFAYCVKLCNFSFHFVIDRNEKLYSFLNLTSIHTITKSSEKLSETFWKKIEKRRYNINENKLVVTFYPRMKHCVNYERFDYQEVINKEHFALFYYNEEYICCSVIFENSSFIITVNEENKALYIISNNGVKRIEAQFIVLNYIKLDQESDIYVKNNEGSLNIYYVGKEFINSAQLDIDISSCLMKQWDNFWFRNDANEIFYVDSSSHTLLEKLKIKSEIPIEKIKLICREEVNGIRSFKIDCGKIKYCVDASGNIYFSESELYLESINGLKYIGVNICCQYPFPFSFYNKKLYGLRTSYNDKLVAKPMFDDICVMESGKENFIICRLSTLETSKHFYCIYNDTHEVASMLKYKPISIENIGLTKNPSFVKTDGTILQSISNMEDCHTSPNNFHVITFEGYKKKMIYSKFYLIKNVFDEVKPLPCLYLPGEESIAYTLIMIGNLVNGKMRYGVIDKYGNQILPMQYNSICYINDYLVADNSVFENYNNSWKLKNPQNAQLLSIAFGYVAFSISGTISVINRKGKSILVDDLVKVIGKGEYEDEFEEGKWELTFNQNTKKFNYHHENIRKVQSNNTWYSNQELKDMYSEAFGDNSDNYWGND